MGQKSSKKPDIYVTDDVTHCNLPENEVTEFVGRAREYTAVNVSVEEGVPSPTKSMFCALITMQSCAAQDKAHIHFFKKAVLDYLQY